MEHSQSLSEKKFFPEISVSEEEIPVDVSPTRPPIINGQRQKKQICAKENGKSILCIIKKVIQCHYPDLGGRMNKLVDPREREVYSLEELILGGVMLFLLKQKSRNEMDNQRRDATFSKNYWRMFKLRLPSMDAVEDLFRILKCDELEHLKAAVITPLFEKRVLHRFRLLGRFFIVAVDATGVHSSLTERWVENVTKTSKNDVVTHMNMILEAKIVTSNGISISICSEWITNPVGKEYNKQDCEAAAYKRLAVKLKKYYPRLPMCLVFDALYCNSPVMDTCKHNQWSFIVVFKNGNLPTVHEELGLLRENAFDQFEKNKPLKKMAVAYKWCNELIYKKHTLCWMRCEEVVVNKDGELELHTFGYLTDLKQTKETIVESIAAGRLRWNIEESYNDQKNRDFGMHHLYSRSSYKAFCNWYQALQIAYNIYMFVVKSIEFRELLDQHSKQTIMHLWKNLLGAISFCDLDGVLKKFEEWIKEPRQVRLCG